MTALSPRSATAAVVPSQGEPLSRGGEPVALVDLLDRVLGRGVVVAGELTLTIADVDLVHISLRALISSVRPDLFGPADPAPGPTLRAGESR